MQLVDYTVEFYMGAATTGEHPAKWSWPSRDLPFLYQRRYVHGIETSIDPDLDVWVKHGLVKAFGKDTGWRLISFKDFLEHFGEERVRDLLKRCRATYLKEGKHRQLDELGCPRVHPQVTL